MHACSSIAHPNVIRPLTLHLADGVVVVVTEHATAGGLLRHVPPGEGLAWGQSRMLFQQLALASDFCHAYGIRLRNVNPQHLLVSLDGHGMPVVKIFDFRAAKDTSWEVRASAAVPWVCLRCWRPVVMSMWLAGAMPQASAGSSRSSVGQTQGAGTRKCQNEPARKAAHACSSR